MDNLLKFMKDKIIKYFIDRPNIIKIFYIIFNLLFVNNDFSWLSTKIQKSSFKRKFIILNNQIS